MTRFSYTQVYARMEFIYTYIAHESFIIIRKKCSGPWMIL